MVKTATLLMARNHAALAAISLAWPWVVACSNRADDCNYTLTCGDAGAGGASMGGGSSGSGGGNSSSTVGGGGGST